MNPQPVVESKRGNYSECCRPACPVCDELVGSCNDPEADRVYLDWLGKETLCEMAEDGR